MKTGWCGSSCSATRWRRSAMSTPARSFRHGRGEHLPGQAFCRKTGWSPPSAPFARSCGSGWMCSTAKANCRRPSGWSNAPSTTRRCWARWATATGGEIRLPSGRLRGGHPPECLDWYFPDDWLLIVDESVTRSQLQAMYNGDQARKKVLIEHGFRLPSAPITGR